MSTSTASGSNDEPVQAQRSRRRSAEAEDAVIAGATSSGISSSLDVLTRASKVKVAPAGRVVKRRIGLARGPHVMVMSGELRGLALFARHDCWK
jgi:hypothetical protein